MALNNASEQVALPCWGMVVLNFLFCFWLLSPEQPSTLLFWTAYCWLLCMPPVTLRIPNGQLWIALTMITYYLLSMYDILLVSWNLRGVINPLRRTMILTLDHLLSFSTDRKRFFSKLAFFEEGTKTVRLLAKIVNLIREPQLFWILDHALTVLFILFMKIYVVQKLTLSHKSLKRYLQRVSFPNLSDAQRQKLNALITLE